jgi:hypothetical protein
MRVGPIFVPITPTNSNLALFNVFFLGIVFVIKVTNASMCLQAVYTSLEMFFKNNCFLFMSPPPSPLTGLLHLLLQSLGRLLHYYSPCMLQLSTTVSHLRPKPTLPVTQTPPYTHHFPRPKLLPLALN